MRSGFGAGSLLVAGLGLVELSLLVAGAGVLLSDDAGAGACVDDVSGAAAGLGVIVLFWSCVCGVVAVLGSVELCAEARPMAPTMVDAAIAEVSS